MRRERNSKVQRSEDIYQHNPQTRIEQYRPKPMSQGPADPRKAQQIIIANRNRLWPLTTPDKAKLLPESFRIRNISELK